MSRPRPLVPYPGGKWYARHMVMAHFPLFTTEMVAPFIGGGAIELTAAHQGCRVHGSDIYPPLVNLYQQALDDPGRLADAVEAFHPMTREGFRQALTDHSRGAGNPTEQAARWYALIRSSYSGRIIEYTVGNYSGHKLRFTQPNIRNLRRFQAPQLSVERLDWQEALEKQPDTFAYLDPPYPEVRRRLYVNHREFDHRRLRDCLAKRQAPWALSINDLPYTRELYRGFNIHPLSWRRLIGGGDLGYLKELVITNY